MAEDSHDDSKAKADIAKRLKPALNKENYKLAIPLILLRLETPPRYCKDCQEARKKFDFNLQDYDEGKELLHRAVKEEHVKLVSYLITVCRCNPWDTDKKGYDTYDIAVEKESSDVLNFLLNHCKEEDVARLVDKAIKHVDILKYLIKNFGFNPIDRLSNGDMTFLHCVAEEGSVDVLKFLINECNCDPMNNDSYLRRTPLHCAALRNQSQVVEFLLLTGKCDPFVKDENNETPLDMTKEKLPILEKFCRTKTSFPVHSYVNVLIVGNPGGGKSTLSHVIVGTANSFTIFGSFRNVGGVVPYTAGIIPHKLQHRDLGNIILHDFAGHPEYYSSHSAVIENLLQGSGGVFLIVVNILEKEAVKQLHQWLTVVRNEAQKTLNQCHTIVVVSHVDEVHDSVQRRRKEEIQEIIIRERCVNVFLDCRKLGGSGVDSFFKNLSSACQFNRNTNKRNLSLYCHMMYGLLEERKENILTLSDVLSAAKDTNRYVIPDNREEVLEVLHSLHSTGLISVLKHEHKTWVVVNKGILLTEVNGILFAPKTFKEHVNIASNTGIVSVSGLTRLFPEYDPDMLICFLKNMELCQEMHPSFLRMTNLQQLPEERKENERGIESSRERLLFFPCLLHSDRPDVIEMTSQVYQFGWCLQSSMLQCTKDHHFFPPRYFHVLSLHLAFKMALPQEDDKLNRRCTFWRNGLYWFNGHGVGSLVEIVDESQCVLVMMSCEIGCGGNMVSLRRDVIGEVMNVYKESCPSLEVKELVIDPKELAYPVNTPRERSVYSVKDILSTVTRKEQFLVNATGIGCKKVTEILPNESLLDISNLSLLGGRDIKVYELIKII